MPPRNATATATASQVPSATDPTPISYLDPASRLVEAQRIADLEARERRAACASTLAGPFIEAFDESEASTLVTQSPFAPFADTYRHREPLLVLAFNLLVTRHVVRALLQEESDPLRLTAAVSRTAELGLHCLYDPQATDEGPDLFLGAAKRVGYFFTPPDVAFALAQASIGRRTRVDTVFDPAAGAGALLAAAMINAQSSGVQIGEIRGVELDPFTADLAYELLCRIRQQLSLDCEVRIDTTDAIDYLYEQAANPDGDRFDCIVMNPPYGRVKFLRGILTNAETSIAATKEALDALDADGKAAAKAQAGRFRQISEFLGVGRGAQDYQRLFTALALAVLSEDGAFAMISSDAWLGDASAETLRKRIMCQRLLRAVTLYPETSGLFATVNQPTAIAVFDRSAKDNFQVRVMSGRQRHEVDAYAVEYEEISRLDPRRLRVPRVPGTLHDIYVRLASAPRLRDVAGLKNARGELDQTLGRDLIQEAPSDLRLVRGDHVERFVLRGAGESNRPSYVDPVGFADAFACSPKLGDSSRPRIVGRQCSYQNKARRLSFSLAAENAVVGNSCNYISVVDHAREDTLLRATLVILNSVVAEFFFRLFNSNNHVANYELDELPMCLDDEEVVDALAKQGEFLMAAYSGTVDGGKRARSLEDLADAMVAHAFGLTGEEALALSTAVDPQRAPRIAGMTEFLNQEGIQKAFLNGQGWFQHVPPGLSELDRQIIDHVPQGGNWQDIPESVPSQRLTQIREMTAWRGIVRTTYYGRLRPDQPAYTIATYFNRPGNGTNIHPWENRTLSGREAARLQSFPDCYVFTGSEGAIRKQVGNAVPPLLGYAIGRHFQNLGFDGPWIDLFAGAGGLSLGLEEAGCSIAAAIDNDSSAALTYRLNRPCETEPSPQLSRTLLLDTDLSIADQATQAVAAIRAKLGGASPTAVVGGPPCQGFSHAGWRNQGDERNHLASVFMRFVADLKPALVLLENVEGLLTYEKGRVLGGLVATLRELGYEVGDKPWLLRAECYGVPQMRRRVFLVAGPPGMPSAPPTPTHQTCRGRRESSQEDPAEGLPYPTTVAEALSGLLPLGEIAHPSPGHRPIRASYGGWLRGDIKTADLFR
jgi:Alw26I/Eco31I/Esp3I family type II restriction m6 adenine DNA methyltransferase